MTEEKKHILLIDDDTSLLVTLSDFLRFEGYDVVTADSGEQGLKKLKGMEPDLIILDMSMHGMGGIGFLKEITDEDGKPGYPVLVLTARANMADFFADVPVDGFVAKPCDPSDLLMEVNRIIFLTSRPEDDAAPSAAAPPAKILIGEDDANLTDTIQAGFQTAGFAASIVSSGPDMIEQAVLQRPHLIVMKYVFSKMNGDAVAELLRDMPQTQGIPIILYDDSGTAPLEESLIREKPAISRLVPSHEADDLVSAARDVLTAGA